MSPVNVFIYSNFISHELVLPGSECLEAPGEDLTLTPDTDPLWQSNPALSQASPLANGTQLSLTCRMAIRYYLHAIGPELPGFKTTLLRICTTILEFGPVVIRCVQEEYPLIAYKIFGQSVRCEFAKDVLGDDWGEEKAEKSKFVDAFTNRTLGAIDFIRDGFVELE
jgi:hypothetical protein